MKKISYLFILLILFSASARALERFEIITTQELKQMLRDRAKGKTDFILVNALDEIIFRHSAIPGSVSLPWIQAGEMADRLGPDKEKLIVTYWMGYRWVFAYKAAVAVKKLGYEHIKIYNGGIKDWKKSGYALDVLEALPEYDARFISAEELLMNLKKAEEMNCPEEQPGLMLLDLRVENFLRPDHHFLSIRTSCPTFACLLDDLRKPEVRQRIPRKGLVVVVTETGNRDIFAMKYLSKFGYANLAGLRFGMRGWIKSAYPVKSSQ